MLEKAFEGAGDTGRGLASALLIPSLHYKIAIAVRIETAGLQTGH